MKFGMDGLDKLFTKMGEIVREMNFNPLLCTLPSKVLIQFATGLSSSTSCLVMDALDWRRRWLLQKIANLSFWFVCLKTATRCRFGQNKWCEITPKLNSFSKPAEPAQKQFWKCQEGLAQLVEQRVWVIVNLLTLSSIPAVKKTILEVFWLNGSCLDSIVLTTLIMAVIIFLLTIFRAINRQNLSSFWSFPVHQELLHTKQTSYRFLFFNTKQNQKRLLFFSLLTTPKVKSSQINFELLTFWKIKLPNGIRNIK